MKLWGLDWLEIPKLPKQLKLKSYASAKTWSFLGHGEWPMPGDDCELLEWLKVNPTNLSKALINHPYFDNLYHPFMVNLGMVYYCFSNLIKDWQTQDNTPNHRVTIVSNAVCLTIPYLFLSPPCSNGTIAKQFAHIFQPYIYKLYIYIPSLTTSTFSDLCCPGFARCLPQWFCRNIPGRKNRRLDASNRLTRHTWRVQSLPSGND